MSAPGPVVRALLLTDLVDSTRLAESLDETRVAEIWAAHDRVARDLLATHRGREIDKTDGFLLMFESAGDAAAYALEYHRALRSLPTPLLARAGLHVGEVVLRENSPDDIARGAKPLEVDGIAKPTAARVMSTAIGGQTLLTAEARAALGTGAAMRLHSHGHWRMKGLAAPIELFEAGDDDSPWQPPPDGDKTYRVVPDGEAWKPVKDVNHALPAERDAFVGRRDDLRRLARALDDGARLVSVLGLGGTGKTRLVTRFAWTWLGDYPGGAWFCDVSEARSADGIASAVARALDVPLGKDDPIVQLGHAIAGRGRCLVILDNFEQVARHAAATLGRWLDRCGQASFIVTTREVLGLRGEQALPLAPLTQADAETLFAERARAARPDFAPRGAELDEMKALVTMLDLLPLAIELAAARVTVMPPSKIRARLSDRFALLASAGRRHDRQATLRATLDWSWDMLDDWEKAGLAQLSVFEGGFTLEAAEAVLDVAAWPAAPLPMDVVQGLLQRSLLRQAADDRLDLLVTVQEYAAEKLRTEGTFPGSGAAAELAAQQRHGAHFAASGTDAALDALDTHRGVEKRQRLAAEIANVVAACRRATARGDAAMAVNAYAAAWAILHLRGPAATGLELGEAILAQLTLEPAHRTAVLRTVATAYWTLGRMDEARAACESAIAIAREAGLRRAEGAALGRLGLIITDLDRLDEAREYFEAALAIHDELGDQVARGRDLANLGNTFREQGRLSEARACFESALLIDREVGSRRFEATATNNLALIDLDEGRMSEGRSRCELAMAIHREIGDRRGEGVALGNLGVVHRDQGRMEEARACILAALAIHREVGHRRLEGAALGNLGLVHADQGELEEALALYEEALAIHRETDSRGPEAGVLGCLGSLHAKRGNADEALAFFASALALFQEVGVPAAEGVILGEVAGVHLDHGRLDEARAHVAQALLRGVTAGGDIAKILCTRARCEWLAGERDAARATLAEAESLAEAAGAGPASELGQMLARARAALENAAPGSGGGPG